MKGSTIDLLKVCSTHEKSDYDIGKQRDNSIISEKKVYFNSKARVLFIGIGADEIFAGINYFRLQ